MEADVPLVGQQALRIVDAVDFAELGMTRATGADYRHVLELLEEVTR